AGSGDEEGGEAAEGDGVHAAEVGVVLPDGIAAGEQSAGEWAGGHEGEEERDEEFSAAEEFREERKEQVEHFFDGERPENVPSRGEVTAASFEDVDVKGEGGEESAGESARFCGDDEVFEIGEVKRAEHGKQREEQRRDAGEAQQVKVANVGGGERVPAA